MSKALMIITHPDPLLRKKGALVLASRIANREFQNFLDGLSKTMIENDGIGIAANQIGVCEQVAIVNMEDRPMHLINPQIISYDKKKALANEACLSVPGLTGTVRRAVSVEVRALDRLGRTIEFTASNLLARVVQHELDHLNGILFIDRAERVWENANKPADEK